MQAVILAGGLGTRLGEVTRRIPKPMVPVLGVPYLEHQLRLLARQQFRSIVLLTGYLGEQVERHFGDGARLGLRITYSQEPSPLGTGGALRMAGRLLERNFLLIYGDSLLPVSYSRLLRRLREARATGVVAAYDNRRGDTTVPSNLALDAEGYVTRYDKQSPGDQGLTHVEAGVLAFRRSVVNWIPDGVVSLEQEVFPRLIAARTLAGLETAQRFYDIGTPDRLKVIEEYLAHDYHPDAISN